MLNVSCRQGSRTPWWAFPARDKRIPPARQRWSRSSACPSSRDPSPTKGPISSPNQMTRSWYSLYADWRSGISARQGGQSCPEVKDYRPAVGEEGGEGQRLAAQSLLPTVDCDLEVRRQF